MALLYIITAILQLAYTARSDYAYSLSHNNYYYSFYGGYITAGVSRGKSELNMKLFKLTCKNSCKTFAAIITSPGCQRRTRRHSLTKLLADDCLYNLFTL